MLDIGFNGTYLNRKPGSVMHLPAKYKSVFPTTIAVSGVIFDEAPDLRITKVFDGYVRSKIPITMSAVEAYIPIK